MDELPQRARLRRNLGLAPEACHAGYNLWRQKRGDPKALQPTSDGLQPTSDGLRPKGDGLQPTSDGHPTY